jgi:hypothetical protein
METLLNLGLALVMGLFVGIDPLELALDGYRIGII